MVSPLGNSTNAVPGSRGWMRTSDFSFGTDILDRDPGPGEQLRAVLERRSSQFKDDDFTSDVSGTGITAWAVGYEAAALHIVPLVGRLGVVLSKLKTL